MTRLHLPWTFGDRINDAWEATPSGCFQEINTADHSAAILVVVRMSDDDADLPTGIATAHLVKAAPDLLALLEELTDIEGPLPGNKEWHAKALAVLASARGST